MNWELYEVWSVDQDGAEELIDTTNSLKEARELAKTNRAVDAEIVEVIIYKEDANGDLIEVEVIA
jgi:hypothetical protein